MPANNSFVRHLNEKAASPFYSPMRVSPETIPLNISIPRKGSAFISAQIFTALSTKLADENRSPSLCKGIEETLFSPKIDFSRCKITDFPQLGAPTKKMLF
ncbi:hypothetical protein D7X25_31800 [bacterium 1XD42-8]|nr:hypothetical protein D7X25_31800 [bacterium 1XD42-8]